MRSLAITLALVTLGGTVSADECIKTKNKVFSELGRTGGATYHARGRKSGRPVVSETQADRDEGLPRSAFERVVEARHGQLEYCYQRRVATGRALSGELELSVVIGADGRVVRAAVASTARDRPLEQCLSQVVARWSFPRAGEATTFRLPLVFDVVNDLQSRR